MEEEKKGKEEKVADPKEPKKDKEKIIPAQDKKKEEKEKKVADPKEPKKDEEKASEDKKEKTESPTVKKKKKINKMTLAEIETKLKEVEDKMGGLNSKYAQHLIQRKKSLTS